MKKSITKPRKELRLLPKNANKILFRCSSLGNIMSGETKMSDSCKNHLADKYASLIYGRRKDIFNKYIAKGLLVEKESLKLYSRLRKEIILKNDIELRDDYNSGTPDTFIGKEILRAQEIIDVKSSWDIFTFMRVAAMPINTDYYWQLQGYMSLSGTEKSTLVYCLINTPPQIIADEKKKLYWRMGIMDDSDQDYLKACAEIDRNSVYDDMPIEKRIIQIPVARNDDDIKRMHQRVRECRKWMSEKLFNKNL